MSESRAAQRVSWWPRAVLTLMAMGLGLACATVVFIGATAGPTSSGAATTAVAQPAAGLLNATRDGVHDRADSSLAVAVGDLVADRCHGGCASHTQDLCSMLAVAAPVSLLALLDLRRRGGFVGLFHWPATAVVPGVDRLHARMPVPSLVSLGTLRV